MTQRGETWVDFDRPPVMEVVFGVQFQPLRSLMTPHVGLLWNRIATDFPVCEDHPPLPPVLEDAEGHRRVHIAVSQVPELPRVWFVSRDERTILQLQRDRFHVNRRRLDRTEDYEGYQATSEAFFHHWREISGFCTGHLQEPPRVLQLELTYVNLIPQEGRFQGLADLGEVLQDVGWAPGRTFLEPPEALNWSASFRLREPEARLHVSARARQTADAASALELELTCRGRFRETGSDAMDAWFRAARRSIDLAFVELTTPAAQTDLWGRRP